MLNTTFIVELIATNQTEKVKGIFRQAIKEGFDLKALNNDFLPVVKAILKHNNTHLLQFLLQNNYDPFHVYLEQNPLFIVVVSSGDLKMTELLINYMHFLKEEDKEHALWLALKTAIVKEDAAMVALLLKYGADPTIYSRCTVYALTTAVQLNNIKIINCLILNGAWSHSVFLDLREEFEGRNGDRNESKSIKLPVDPIERKSKYRERLQVLLDRSVGQDFKDLNFLEGIDISELNFVGISVKGVPVTRQYLIDCGFKGAEHALVTLSQIDKLKDNIRQSILVDNIEAVVTDLKMTEKLDRNKPILLTSLGTAVKWNNLTRVKVHLTNQLNPNELCFDKYNIRKHPLLLAVELGHVEIAIALAESFDINMGILKDAIELSQKMQSVLTVKLKEIFARSAKFYNNKTYSYIRSVTFRLDGSIEVDVSFINGSKPNGCFPSRNPDDIYSFCKKNRFALGPEILAKIQSFLPVHNKYKKIEVPSEKEFLDELCNLILTNQNEIPKLLSCIDKFSSPELTFNRYQIENPIFGLFQVLRLHYIRNAKFPLESLKSLGDIMVSLRDKGAKLPANFWLKNNKTAPDLDQEQLVFDCFMSLYEVLDKKPGASEKFQCLLEKTPLWSTSPQAIPTKRKTVKDFENISLSPEVFDSLKDYFTKVADLFSDVDQCIALLKPIEDALKDFPLNTKDNPPIGYISDEVLCLPICKPDFKKTKKSNQLRKILIDLLKNDPECPEINLMSSSGDFANTFGFAATTLANHLLGEEGIPFWEKRYAQWLNIHSSTAHIFQISVMALAHKLKICQFPEGMTLKDILHYAVSEAIRLEGKSIWDAFFDKVFNRYFGNPSFVQSKLMSIEGSKLAAYMRDSFWSTCITMAEKFGLSVQAYVVFDLMVSGIINVYDNFTLTDLQEKYKSKGIEMVLVDSAPEHNNVFFKRSAKIPKDSVDNSVAPVLIH